MIFADFKQAFDLVDHHSMLNEKLRIYSLNPTQQG